MLYARVSGAWVPIGTGITPTPSIVPAYIGPGHDVPTTALFGYYTHGGRIGYASNVGGGLDIIAGAGNAVFFYTTNVLTDPMTYTQMAVVGSTRFTLPHSWALGPHPAAGAYAGLWRTGAESISDYVLLARPTETLLNVPAGGYTGFRIGNSGAMEVKGGSVDILSRPLNVGGLITGTSVLGTGGVTSNTDVHAVRRFYQNGPDTGFGTAWNEAQFVSAGAGYYGARVGLNWSSTAAQMRVGQWDPNSLSAVNMDMSAMVPYTASAFNVVSTASTKRRIRTLRPQRERIVVRHPKMSDVVPPPDIMALRPVAYRPLVGEFEWNQETETAEPATHPIIKHHGDRERLGLIAEDVATVIPSAVNFTLDGDVRSIDYAQITVALLDHVQQLTETVATLKYRITELENAR
jgi:hypothetical protein